MKHILVSLCFAALCSWGLSTSLCAEDSQVPAGTKVLRDLPYVTDGHAKQKLDLYVPASPKGPLIVWIHGGGWFTDSKKNPLGLPVLALGFCVASLDYRYSDDAIFPAQIEDCKAAIRWLRAHASEYGYDPKRVAVMGQSAGGHLTALLATTGSTRVFDVGDNLDQSSAIQCGIDMFGPTNLAGWKTANTDPMLQRSGATSIFVRLLGGAVDDKMDLAMKASPVIWASKDSAPLFIQHGTADPLVGLEQSQELADKLKAVGVDVILDVVTGGGHGGPQFWAGDRPQRMLEFINRHLSPPGQHP